MSRGLRGPGLLGVLGLVGLVGLLAAPMLLTLGCGRRPAARNLVVISLDTVRRDHLSAYGYGRPTTPVIDRVAASGAVFDTAIAQDTNTNPSHASMFTGLYPAAHGSLHNGVPVGEEQTTLAERLKAAGFRTAAFVSGLPLKRPITGLDQGFEVYGDRFEGKRRGGGETVDRALAWLGEGRRDERFFLFVHLYDNHGPYLPPPELGRVFVSRQPGPAIEVMAPYQTLRVQGEPVVDLNVYVDLYDSLIRYQDLLVGRLLERVAEVTGEETAVVILSDHGEVLGGRYWSLDHGGTVFDEEIRIPLIVAGPGVVPGRLAQTVETVDLVPTLLDLLGLPPAEEPLPGRNLASLLAGEGRTGAPRAAFSSARPMEERHVDRGYRLDARRFIRSIRAGRWKLIRYPGAEGEDFFELYDLERDPGETVDLAVEEPAVRDRLARQLELWQRSAGGSAAGEAPGGAADSIPEDLRRQLESLGYVGGVSDSPPDASSPVAEHSEEAPPAPPNGSLRDEP